MARIEQPRIPPRPAARTGKADPVRRRAREVERLHQTPEVEDRDARAVEGAGRAAPPPEAQSIEAPGVEYLAPLVGMSRDRMIAGLTRLEHAMARLDGAGGGAPSEMTLARTMLAEHLRRLRLVDVERGPAGSGR